MFYELDAKHADNIMLLEPLPAVKDLEPNAPAISWESGVRFKTRLQLPLQLEIVDGYEIDTVPPVYTSRVPMMRDDLLTCIRRVGVHNIDAYPAIIKNLITKTDISGFSAINIVGAISLRNPFPPPNLLMFRFEVTTVAVHERVKVAIQSSSEFESIEFRKISIF